MNLFLREEETAMWLFLLRKIHDPDSGEVKIGIVKPRGLAIWRQFREEVTTSRTDTSLRKRFSIPCFPMPREIPEIDEIGVVKLHFALSIALEDDHLETLRQSADIELDEKKCILKYRGHTNGLILETDKVESTPSEGKRKAGRNDEKDEVVEVKRSDRPLTEVQVEVERSGNSLEEVQVEMERENSEDVPEAVAEVVADLHEEAELQVSQFLSTLYSSKRKEFPLLWKSPVGTAAVSQRSYLEHLKTCVDEMSSTALEDVQNRIEAAIQDLDQTKDKRIPIERFRLILETTLAMMGL